MKKHLGEMRRLPLMERLFVDRFTKKMAAVILLGGKCVRCGESDILALDFHHIEHKVTNVANLRLKPWLEFITEARKCELLCRNCHGRDNTNVERFERLKDLIRERAERMVKMALTMERRAEVERKR